MDAEPPKVVVTAIIATKTIAADAVKRWADSLQEMRLPPELWVS